jgi:mono/diheme cytochrome c family protein
MRSRRCLPATPVVTVLILLCCIDQSALSDEETTRPGLAGVFSDSTSIVQKVDDRIAFDWTDTSPDGRLGDDYQAKWQGHVLVRQPGKHTFHAMVSGRLTIIVDGKLALQAEGENLFHSAEPIELAAGDHSFEVSFKRTKDTDARLQLFWSSPEFTLEPLPADVLTHEATDTTVSDQESGGLLADAMRCSACHSGLAEASTLKAPSLKHVNETPLDELVQRLMNPKSVNAHSAMPSFGLTAEDARDVALFLMDAADKESPLDEKELKFKADDADAGSKLLLTTGCIACHRLSQFNKEAAESASESSEALPDASPYHGPELVGIEKRRTAKWLSKWLQAPGELNPDHRMPVFSLSDDERRQIVAALVVGNQKQKVSPAGSDGSKDEDSTPSLEASVTNGRRIATAANCAGCHSIKGLEPSAMKIARPTKLQSAASHNCLAVRKPQSAAGDDSGAVHRPSFQITDGERQQLYAWLTSLRADMKHVAGATLGSLLMHRNGCLACHDRDLKKGISAHAGFVSSLRNDLNGQSQTLIPPALTAAGDKLKDEYLMSAVSGEQAGRRLPWLLVRMPKFRFSADEKTAVTRYLVGADRIPDAADVAREELFRHLNPHHPVIATPADLLTGNHLIGAGGFNCIACHKAGPYEPRNVAMGTRGSDIMSMGQRIRPRYFMRWMENPIRVVPGIEMPAIRKPIPGVLEDSLPQQIALMWTALADPKFSPPTVVSRYEQFVTVAPGQPPRVVRDVFTVGDPKDRNSVARSMAVGFNNGHNILIDLDTMRLRQWTIGEFARQRTEGKSWFWDMAGVTVSLDQQVALLSRLVSKTAKDKEPLSPVTDQRRQAELISSKVTDQSVILRVRYYFDPSPQASQQTGKDTKNSAELSRHTAITAWNDPTRSLLTSVVTFTIQPSGQSGDQTGWLVKADVEESPNDYLLLPEGWSDAESSAGIPWSVKARTENNASAEVRLQNGETATLQFSTSVKPPVIVPPGIPRAMSSPDEVTSLPGFEGWRLPIDTAIMPTAMTWLADGRLAFTSLRGQVWIADDQDKDGSPDALTLFAEGLAAPYGIQADGSSILVSHKPEILRLRDTNEDGRADEFDVFASGWGFSDDYHDWTTALARDQNGDYFVGLGSDYSQNNRPADNDRWRGTVLKVNSAGTITPVAFSMRFPMGLAFDSQNRLFATDNQGVQNTFNEINHVIEGKHYGVPSRHETVKEVVAETPALMVPHPWTRSVNSITFFPKDYVVSELAGHGVGCEYDTRCLIRFTVQEVNGTVQGASYRFSLPDQPSGGGNFVGPVASAIGPDGGLYIGSIWDSGWQGGTNTGTIERMVPAKRMPNGIREIRATVGGFEVSFFHPFTADKATDVSNWSLQGYTRSWGGSYATPDSDRHPIVPSALTVSEDLKTVSIQTAALKAGYVYEISVKKPLDESAAADFWPTEGHYSMKVVPK